MPKTKTEAARVLIVDTNSLVRRGLRLRLTRADDIEVVAEATTADDAIEIAFAEQVDIVVMDPQMSSGLDAIRVLTGADAKQRASVVVLTTSPRTRSCSTPSAAAQQASC